MTIFQKVATGAFLAVALLIFVGAIVRVTGSGLGCPDWPRCWGYLIPPTSVEGIELDDRTYEKIRAKGERRGLPSEELTRERILESFNPVHTWIEYVNRLTSLPVGLLTLGTFVMSFWQRSVRPTVFWGAFLCLLIVLLNAWMGARVVFSGLKPGIITLHMALAFLLVVLQVYVAWRGTGRPWAMPVGQGRGVLRALVLGLILLVVVEGVMGSQVREMTDELAKSHLGESRADWIGELEEATVYLLHRSFSWLLVVGTATWFWLGRKSRGGRSHWLEIGVLGLMLAMMVLGVIMAHIAVYEVVQVLHVGLTALILAGLMLAFLGLGRGLVVEEPLEQALNDRKAEPQVTESV